jgi:hypothetical protein
MALIACTCGSTIAFAAPIVIYSGVVADAIDGVVVNGIAYDVTFADNFTDTTFANNAPAVATAASEVDAALNATTAEFVSIPGIGNINNFVIGDRLAGGTTVTSFSAEHNWQNEGSIFQFGSGADSVFTKVPEPASVATLGAGLLGLGLYRRGKRA